MLPEYLFAPPEVNSGLMYTGPGAGPMLAAATAWSELAGDLGSAASSYGSVISGLAGGPWLGPSSMAMTTAASPYLTWLSASAMQAEQTSANAMAAAAAYEAAFAMTVPPSAIAANRAQLMALTATNFFGQNTPAIMATEAQYMQMWAQDAAAMSGYDASSSALAAQLTPFDEPPESPSAADAQAADLMWQLSQSLGATQSSIPGLSSSLEMLSTPAQLAMSPMSMALSQLMNVANPLGSGGSAPAMGSALASTTGSATGAVRPAQLGVRTVSAGVGRAGSVGALSVPPTWATAVSASAPNPTVTALPASGVSQVTANVPRLPFKAPPASSGRGASSVTQAISAPRVGVLPRPVVG